MTARELAERLRLQAIFEELAARAEFAGDLPWRVRAYQEVAHLLAKGAIDLAHPERFEEVRGVGRNLAAKLRQALAREPIPALVRLAQDQPPELLGLLSLPGVGIKTARRLWEQGVGRVAELEALVRQGHSPPGMTRRQLDSLAAAFRVRAEGIPWLDLLPFSQELVARLEPPAAAAGGLRRADPVVSDPVWVAADTQANRRVAEEFPVSLPLGYRIPRGALRLVPPSSFGAALLLATGPERFLTELAEPLARAGARLGARGLEAGDRLLPAPDEEALFRLAGLEVVPAHLRGLPAELRARGPWRAMGDLHCHSLWSDGLTDIATLARAALDRGYRYLAVTDHAAGPAIARGLTTEQFLRQRREVEQIRGELPPGFHLLHGCEVNIAADGSLDLPDELLATFDVVVASPHSDLDQGSEDATQRLVRAASHPAVSILGHPGGRKLGRRPPLPADWERVLDAAAEHGVAVEMNASPRRLDLDYRVVHHHPRRERLLVAVDTDAHAPAELDNVAFGLLQAQKAGLRPEQVWNLRPAWTPRPSPG